MKVQRTACGGGGAWDAGPGQGWCGGKHPSVAGGGSVGLEWGDGGKGGAQLAGTWAFTLSEMGSFWKVLMKSMGTSLLLYGEQIRREEKGHLLGVAAALPVRGRYAGAWGRREWEAEPIKATSSWYKLLLVGRRVGQSGFGGGRSWESGGTYSFGKC